MMSVPVCIDPPSTVALRIPAETYETAALTAELCRRRSRIADAQGHQLFAVVQSISTPNSNPWHSARTADNRSATGPRGSRTGWSERQFDEFRRFDAPRA